MQTDELQYSTKGFYVWMEDSASAGAGKTGLTLTIKLSKAGGSQATVTPPVTEIGEGLYWIEPFGAHRDTPGRNAWTFAGTGAVLAKRVENVVGETPSLIYVPTSICFDVDSGTGVGVEQAQLAAGYVASSNHYFRTALRFDFSGIDSSAISSATLRITKDGVIDASETQQHFKVHGVRVDDTLPGTNAEFTSDISGLSNVTLLSATVEAVADGNELAIDLTTMFSAIASDSGYALVYLTDNTGGGINFSDPVLEVEASTTAIDNDVNIVSVGGTAVASPDDLKADVSALATAANLTIVAQYLDTEIQAILEDTNELQLNQSNWLTATGFAVPGDAMILTAGAISAIDTELTGTHGSGAWTTGTGGGGDATLANQTAIIDAIAATQGVGFLTGTHSLVAMQAHGDTNWNSVDADEAAIIAGVISGLKGIQIVVPAGTTAGSLDDLYLTQGDDYTEARAIEIPVTSDADLSTYSLVVTAIKGDESITLVLPITGTVGSQVSSLNPAGTVTKLWTVGTYTLQYKVRFAENVEQTIKRGRLHVQAFATPAAA